MGTGSIPPQGVPGGVSGGRGAPAPVLPSAGSPYPMPSPPPPSAGPARSTPGDTGAAAEWTGLPPWAPARWPVPAPAPERLILADTWRTSRACRTSNACRTSGASARAGTGCTWLRTDPSARGRRLAFRSGTRPPAHRCPCRQPRRGRETRPTRRSTPCRGLGQTSRLQRSPAGWGLPVRQRIGWTASVRISCPRTARTARANRMRDIAARRRIRRGRCPWRSRSATASRSDTFAARCSRSRSRPGRPPSTRKGSLRSRSAPRASSHPCGRSHWRSAHRAAAARAEVATRVAR